MFAAVAGDVRKRSVPASSLTPQGNIAAGSSATHAEGQAQRMPSLDPDADAAHAEMVELAMSPIELVSRIFEAVFGKVDMTVTDYMLTMMLVGVRHRLTKPAYKYRSAPVPSWLSGNERLAADEAREAAPLDPTSKPLPSHSAPQSQTMFYGDKAQGHILDPQLGLQQPEAQQPEAPQPGLQQQQPEPSRAQHAARTASRAAALTVPVQQQDMQPRATLKGQASGASEEQPIGGTPYATSLSSSSALRWYSTASKACSLLELHRVSVADGAGSQGQAGGPSNSKLLSGEAHASASASASTPQQERDHVELHVLEEAMRYMRYAAGAYGWKMHMWYYRKSGEGPLGT